MNLGDVSDEVYIAFNKQVVKTVTGDHRFGIHVSDLIEPKCLRNVYYSKLLKVPMTGETCKQFYGGNIVHLNSELATIPAYHEFTIAYNPFTDKTIDLEKERKSHPDEHDPFWLTVVIGTIDDVMKMPDGTHIIADKKTKLTKATTMVFGKPYTAIKPEHKSQLNMYRLMLNRKTGIDAKFGCILSLDFADKFVSPKPQAFELEDPTKIRMEMISRMEALAEHLKSKTLPKRTIIEWMCNSYCPYYSMCFDGDGKNV